MAEGVEASLLARSLPLALALALALSALVCVQGVDAIENTPGNVEGRMLIMNEDDESGEGGGRGRGGGRKGEAVVETENTACWRFTGML